MCRERAASAVIALPGTVQAPSGMTVDADFTFEWECRLCHEWKPVDDSDLCWDCREQLAVDSGDSPWSPHRPAREVAP
jgi:hypothetical protein